jgi:hypothetical protein
MNARWILLLHQIPPNPGYLRAKVMRRLNQLGALPIKNSAYILPDNEETQEDFEWLRREIAQGGGEGWTFRCDSLGGLSDAEIEDRFRKLRTPDFAALAEECRTLLEQLRGKRGEPVGESALRKLRRRQEELGRIDFFQAQGRQEVEVLMKEIERSLEGSGAASGTAAATREYHGRTWVTRKGVKVDRMASAWLIRRFIDPAAKFVFVDPANYQHRDQELRFDMFEGEFTHEGELCTFEVLTKLVGAEDTALQAIGEVVHDIDLKEARYQRPETAGIAPLIDGIALRHSDDARRLEEGATIFDALYAQYGREVKA